MSHVGHCRIAVTYFRPIVRFYIIFPDVFSGCRYGTLSRSGLIIITPGVWKWNIGLKLVGIDHTYRHINPNNICVCSWLTKWIVWIVGFASLAMKGQTQALSFLSNVLCQEYLSNGRQTKVTRSPSSIIFSSWTINMLSWKTIINVYNISKIQK